MLLLRPVVPAKLQATKDIKDKQEQLGGCGGDIPKNMNAEQISKDDCFDRDGPPNTLNVWGGSSSASGGGAGMRLGVDNDHGVPDTFGDGPPNTFELPVRGTDSEPEYIQTVHAKATRANIKCVGQTSEIDSIYQKRARQTSEIDYVYVHNRFCLFIFT